MTSNNVSKINQNSTKNPPQVAPKSILFCHPFLEALLTRFWHDLGSHLGWICGRFWINFGIEVEPKSEQTIVISPENLRTSYHHRRGRSCLTIIMTMPVDQSEGLVPRTDYVFLVRGCRVVRSSGVCHGHVVQANVGCRVRHP